IWLWSCVCFFFQAEDGIRDRTVTGVQTCALPISQDFFARALEKGLLAEADPTRGRFRSFLRTVCAHFLANRHDWERARKRGGGQIGRASCRERVERAGVGVAVEEKSEVDQRGRSW